MHPRSNKLLFFAWEVNSIMLTELSAIAGEQAKPTEKMLMKTKQFLDYATTNNEAIVMYQASNIAVHSDASYLNEPKARSRVGGHFFMSTDNAFPPNNGAFYITVQVIKQVTSSTEEAELGALYINSKLATQMQHTLAEMGHLQPPTVVQRENSTAYKVVMNKIIPKATKVMDMHFH